MHEYKMTFQKQAEARRLATEFKKFVLCESTKYVKDFYTRFGLTQTRFYYYMKWADKNVAGFNYDILKKELSERNRRMGY